MAMVALIVGLFPAGDSYAAYVMVTRGHPDALAILGAWIQSWYWFLLLALIFVYLPLLFPDGRLPSRRWLPVAVLVGIGTLVTVVLGALMDTLTGQNVDYKIDNPIGIEGLAPVEKLPVFGVLGVYLGIGILGAFASVVVRFKGSRGVERQQMKWFLYAATPVVRGSGLLAGCCLQPRVRSGDRRPAYRRGDRGAQVSPLRDRPDINRTLVYASLTAALGLIYLGGVVSLQYAFRALTGQGSQIAIVASTLAIAALFNPLRRRVQAFVDRLFYRRKYDAAKTLATFSSTLR
jgi:hypothetical protein